jgi:hypothetical protein
MSTFSDWLDNAELSEGTTRYSVEVNFRTKLPEVLDGYAKIALGFVSAALKQADFHVKQVFDDGLIRILVSTRNWDDGEWVVVLSWNPHHKAFVMTPGHYNTLNKSVSFKKHASTLLKSDNPSELTKLVKDAMDKLKNVPDRHVEKLKKVPLKRGPK